MLLNRGGEGYSNSAHPAGLGLRLLSPLPLETRAGCSGCMLAPAGWAGLGTMRALGCSFTFLPSFLLLSWPSFYGFCPQFSHIAHCFPDFLYILSLSALCRLCDRD